MEDLLWSNQIYMFDVTVSDFNEFASQMEKVKIAKAHEGILFSIYGKVLAGYIKDIFIISQFGNWYNVRHNGSPPCFRLFDCLYDVILHIICHVIYHMIMHKQIWDSSTAKKLPGRHAWLRVWREKSVFCRKRIIKEAGAIAGTISVRSAHFRPSAGVSVRTDKMLSRASHLFEEERLVAGRSWRA